MKTLLTILLPIFICIFPFSVNALDSQPKLTLDIAKKMDEAEKKVKDFSKFRWAVDEIEDLNLVKEIVNRIKKIPILTEDIIEILDNEPQLRKINQSISSTIHDKYSYFLKKISDTKKFNLDEESLFMEFEEEILNG